MDEEIKLAKPLRRIEIKEQYNIFPLKSLVIRNFEKITDLELDKLFHMGAIVDSKTKQRYKNPDLVLDNVDIGVNQPLFEVNDYLFEKEDIIYEDNYYIFAYKKSGFPTIPTCYSDTCSLSYAISEYYEKKRKISSINIVNRIDLPTQGLVIFAKNRESAVKMNKILNDKKITKCYLVKTPKFELTKKSYIIKDLLEWKSKMKESVTYVRFYKETDNFYYFYAFPKTGRTHQIRKHFAKYLTPIFGDGIYGDYPFIGELGLLCFYYKFIHPETGKMTKIKYIPDNFIC